MNKRNSGFFGMDGMRYAIGIVEDRFDPLMLGRVRVRWFGLHTEDKSLISTQDLPWSEVVQQSGWAMMTPPVEGTLVLGIAKDPNTLQEWIVLGVVPSMNTIGASPIGKWGSARGSFQSNLRKTATDIFKGFFGI